MDRNPAKAGGVVRLGNIVDERSIPEMSINYPAWEGFTGGEWQDEIDPAEFIRLNYTPYAGDASFLANATDATTELWNKLQALQKEERAKGGVLDMDTDIVSSITSHKPGYLDKNLEKIVGLQTDKPLKRAFMPYGGIKMAEEALTTYGYKPNPELHRIFTEYHKTHNQGVYDAYTPEMRKARKNKIITGLPDTYGRGRIVGDYRRVALYGIDLLIAGKERDLPMVGVGSMPEDVIRGREEVSEQIRALKAMKVMAASYGYDISGPATNAREAVQWTYFGYLAAIKTQNGAAMSIGRISTFLDIYIERVLKRGILTETEAQELIDHLVLKFRMVKFARIPEYNQLFSGDPVWATINVAGMCGDGRSMVTKTDYRILHTLETMGPSPEPNLTVLYSPRLPEAFKRYAAKISIATSSVQYENDEIMRRVWSDDYAICCCVSATHTGKEMQFFGARANLAKCLLYAINGGVDEKTRAQVGPELRPITDDVLDYAKVLKSYHAMMDWLAGLYVHTLNLIHFMHDRYYYEAAQMALIDTDLERTFATGIAGFSHAVDSLSAIKYAKVKVIRDGACRRLQGRGRLPALRQRRPAGGRHREGAPQGVHEQDPQPPHLPPRDADDLDPHDHVERRLRQGDGRDAGRTQGGRAAVSGGEPELRRGEERPSRLAQLGREAALRLCARRHLQHADDPPLGPRQRRGDAGDDARARAGRLLLAGGAPPERERLRHGEAGRCDGASGEAGVRELHDPRLGLRREVHRPHPRAAARRDQPHLP